MDFSNPSNPVTQMVLEEESLSGSGGYVISTQEFGIMLALIAAIFLISYAVRRFGR